MLILMKIHLFIKSRKGKDVEGEHETLRAAEFSKPIKNEEEEEIPEEHDMTEPQKPE